MTHKLINRNQYKELSESKAHKEKQVESDLSKDLHASNVPIILSTAELLNESLFFVGKTKIDIRATKVLVALTSAPTKGLWRTTLAELIGTEQRDGSFSELLKKLEEAGYIERIPDKKGDIFIRLTTPDGFNRANAILNVIQLEALTRIETYKGDLKKELLTALSAILDVKEELAKSGLTRATETSKVLNGLTSSSLNRSFPSQRR